METLRHVRLDLGYTLRTYETNERAPTGQQCLGYEFRDASGRIIFAGQNFGCSPMHAIDSDESLRSLLTFLTLRPGDTDSGYFEAYTPEQLDFCETDAEVLSIWADDENESLVFEDIE